MKCITMVLSLLMALLPPVAVAQLSPPIAGGIPSGSGPGVHSPDSPFAPLPQRTDVVAWSVRWAPAKSC